MYYLLFISISNLRGVRFQPVNPYHQAIGGFPHMAGLNHATQDSTGSNIFGFPSSRWPNGGPSSPASFPAQDPKPGEPETAEPQARAASLTPEAGCQNPGAGRTPNPDNPDKPNTSPATGNSMTNQQDPPPAPSRGAPQNISDIQTFTLKRQPPPGACRPSQRAAGKRRRLNPGSRKPEAGNGQGPFPTQAYNRKIP